MVFVLLGVFATTGNGFRVWKKCFLHSLRAVKCVQGNFKTWSWISAHSKINKLTQTNCMVAANPEIRVQFPKEDSLQLSCCQEMYIWNHWWVQSLIMQIVSAKSSSVRGTSYHPAITGSCPTLCICVFSGCLMGE